MKTIITALRSLALAVPEILLPRKGVDLSRWAVIACDQFTQDRSYWAALSERIGTAPSTLSMILPEVYLEDGDRRERLAAIRNSMKKYLESGVFAAPQNGFIYIERQTAYGRTRKGLIAAIDLDKYDWKPDSTAEIRATEATIVERIPPRMEIRRGAPLESPHIMLLVNDPERTLVEAAGKRVRGTEPLYDTVLEPASGRITGYAVSREDDLSAVAEALETLACAGRAADGSTFLFAVGDGNHSLATAKAVWDEFRAAHQAEAAAGKIDLENHPARFALVEIVNLYDEGLTFEPIHRVLFNTDLDSLTSYLATALGGKVFEAGSAREMEELVESRSTTRFGFVSTKAGKTRFVILESPDSIMAVSRLQPVLDRYLAGQAGISIDYIHGSEEVFRLGAQAGAVAILLPPVEKDSFFTTISSGGPLPRKSFSMGEASEKRFYMECRKLF